MKNTVIKNIAALSAAALLATSASAIVIDISSVGDSGIKFGGDSSVSFFGNADGHVFEVNDTDGAVGDSTGLFGSISGVWSIDPWSSNTTTLSGGPGVFQIWDADGETFMADLALMKIGTVLSGGVMNGATNLSNFSYAGTNSDLLELYNWGSATLSMSFEIANGPSNLTLDYLANTDLESTFSGDLATSAAPIPDGGTTSALLGFGILAVAAASRRKGWKKAA